MVNVYTLLDAVSKSVAAQRPVEVFPLSATLNQTALRAEYISIIALKEIYSCSYLVAGLQAVMLTLLGARAM